MSHGYRRARTLGERRKRMFFGAIGGVLMLALFVPVLGLLSLIDKDSALFKPLLYGLLIGLPVGLAILLELWLGRRDP